VEYSVKIAWDDEYLCWYSECEELGLYLCDESFSKLVNQNKAAALDLQEARGESLDFDLSFQVLAPAVQELAS
jgi:hypothetical protein